MPQIQQYNQQIDPSGPTGVQRATGEDFGSGIAQGMSELGKSTAQLQDAIHNRKAQNDLSELDANMAAAKDSLGLRYQDKLQKGTLDHDDFMQNDVNDQLQNVGDQVNTREGQVRFNQMQASAKLQFSQEAQAGQAHLAGLKAVQETREASDSRTSFVMGNPERFQDTLQEQNQAIDDKVATGMLPAANAPELKREFMDKLAAGAIRGTMQTNPQLARQQLDSGMWDNYMNENTKYKMDNETDRALRARGMDDERQQRLLEKAATARQEAVATNFLEKMHDPNGPGLSAKDVLTELQKGTIDSSTAEHFFKAVDSENSEKKLKSNPHVYNDLAQRLTLPDSDPRKITDIADINKHIGRDLSVPDASTLYGLLAEKHTPQGEADAARQQAYFKTQETALVKKNALGLEDPQGREIYQQLQSDSYEYALNAAKNGKSKTQIWAPTIAGKPNPDYVGNHVQAPTRSIQDIMKSTTDLMNKTNQPPETTEMILPDGKHAFIPNKNVDAATKRGAKPKDNK